MYVRSWAVLVGCGPLLEIVIGVTSLGSGLKIPGPFLMLISAIRLRDLSHTLYSTCLFDLCTQICYNIYMLV